MKLIIIKMALYKISWFWVQTMYNFENKYTNNDDAENILSIDVFNVIQVSFVNQNVCH